LKYSFEPGLLNACRFNGIETIYSKPHDPSEWRSVTLEALKKIFGCSKSIMTNIVYGIAKKVANLIISESTYENGDKMNKKIQKEFLVSSESRLIESKY
jgi:hypothetical protein